MFTFTEVTTAVNYGEVNDSCRRCPGTGQCDSQAAIEGLAVPRPDSFSTSQVTDFHKLRRNSDMGTNMCFIGPSRRDLRKWLVWAP